MKRPPRSHGVYNGALHDSKVLDIIGMFEAQRGIMEKEIHFLR